jgi:hypothetical protein
MRFFLAFAFAAFVSFGASADTLPKVMTKTIQTDKAKKIRADVSCGLPRRDSYKRKRGVMIFTLHNGDTGKCPTDAKADKSETAKRQERAEVAGAPHKFGPTYRFSAQVHMSPEHDSSRFTTFFQVHQWIDDACECGAPFMLSFHEGNKLLVRTLKAHHRHKLLYIPGWTRKSFEDKWVEVAVDIETQKVGFSNIRVYLGGRLVHEGKTLLQEGGQLYFKTGLYRDVETSAALPSDRVYVRNARLARIK